MWGASYSILEVNGYTYPVTVIPNKSAAGKKVVKKRKLVSDREGEEEIAPKKGRFDDSDSDRSRVHSRISGEKLYIIACFTL